MLLLFFLMGAVRVSATFVAGGVSFNVGAIVTSPDGSAGSWVSRACPMTGVNSDVRGVTYMPDFNTWLITGQGVVHTIAKSTDGGQTWTGLGTSVFALRGNGVAWGQGKVVMMGEGVNSMAIFDGFAVLGLGLSTFDSFGFAAFYSNGQNRWVATGGGSNQIATSTDALTWTPVGSGIFAGGNGFGVAFGGGIWVVGGSGANTLASSPDGIAWTGRGSSIFLFSCLAVAYANNRFVAMGFGPGGNTMAYSDDGLSFTGLGEAMFAQGRGITFNGMWIAVGLAGNGTLATSTDGITFESQGFVLRNIGNAVAGDNDNACGVLPSCTCTGMACTSTIPVTINATLTVSTGSTLTVQGSVTLTSNSTLKTIVSAPPTGPLLTATSFAIIDGTLELLIGAVLSGTVTVLSAASISGTFNNIHVSSSNSCSSITSSPVYSSTTFTVAFQTTNHCSSTLPADSLPTGAIVGIAVGAFIASAFIVIVVVLLMRRFGAVRDAKENARIRGDELDKVIQSNK